MFVMSRSHALRSSRQNYQSQPISPRFQWPSKFTFFSGDVPCVPSHFHIIIISCSFNHPSHVHRLDITYIALLGRKTPTINQSIDYICFDMPGLVIFVRFREKFKNVRDSAMCNGFFFIPNIQCLYINLQFEDKEHLQQYLYWLLVFYAPATHYRLYRGDGHEVDDKINMKWWWRYEKGTGHKGHQKSKKWILKATGNGEKWVGTDNFAYWSGAHGSYS